MHRVLIIPVVLCAMWCARCAEAQAVHVPSFWVWGSRPSGQPAPPIGSPVLRAATRVYAIGAVNSDSPEACAWETAQLVLAQIADGSTTPDRVCIILQGFGQDGGGEVDNPLSHEHTSMLRFFREEDRIPEIDDFSPFQFPQPRPPHTNYEIRDARAYRHPFLINATDDAPLRAWMRRFCAEYEAIRTDPGHVHYSPNLPAPARFYFDTESSIAPAAGPNPVFMLDYLAGRLDYWSNPNRPVPGIEPPTTLANLYASASLEYGLPADIHNEEHGLLVGPNAPASHGRNRAIMLWWYRVCQGVQEYIMKNCAYDVVHDTWPDCQVGNYDASNMDNEVGETGWFYDMQNPASPVASMLYRRANTNSVWSHGARMHVHSTGRWLALPGVALGDVSMPEVYPATTGMLLGENGSGQYADGWADAGGHVGHQQPNIYLPPVSAQFACGDPPAQGCHQTFLGHCLEDRLEVGLRLNRHEVEAIINSKGGEHEDEVVPWLAMVWTEWNDPPPGGFGSVGTSGETRPFMAMLRAKNIREGVFWSNWGDNPSGAAGASWSATQTLVKDVWASRVHAYERTIGTAPAGDEYDVAKLEFTLLKNGSPKEVVVNGVPVQGGGIGTELIVEMRGLQGYESATSFEVVFECSSDKPFTRGQVQAYDYANNEWVVVPQDDVPPFYQDLDVERGPRFGEGAWYKFYTPDISGAWYATRRWCRLNTAGRMFLKGSTGHMLLKLVQLNDSTGFASRYDLLQVIPIVQTAAPGSGPTPIVPLQSDANHDGVIDSFDVLQFMDAYDAGTLAADSDVNGDVNADDVGSFMSDFDAESTAP